MAANFSDFRVYPFSVQRICSELRSSRLCTMLKLINKGEIPGAYQFNFKHDVSLTSWGEDITVTLHPIEEGKTSVVIRSECALPTQVIDWGKNKENVNAMLRHLDTFLPMNFEDANANGQIPQNTAPNGVVTASAPFCPKCGVAVSADAKFCSKCGTKVK